MKKVYEEGRNILFRWISLCYHWNKFKQVQTISKEVAGRWHATSGAGGLYHCAFSSLLVKHYCIIDGRVRCTRLAPHSLSGIIGLRLVNLLAFGILLLLFGSIIDAGLILAGGRPEQDVFGRP